jgi:dTMP kinase
MKGSIVVLCGGEGSGKSTIIKRVAKEQNGNRILLSREPSGSPRAEEIRQYLFSEDAKDLHPEAQFDLMWGARKDHVHKIIMPAITTGKVVLLDRFDCCTYAYQIFGSQLHDLKLLFRIQREAILCYIPPPTYIWLNIDPILGLMRKRGVEDRNTFDGKDIEFHKRVRDGYADFTGIGRVIELDASLPADEVWENFKTAFENAIA